MLTANTCASCMSAYVSQRSTYFCSLASLALMVSSYPRLGAGFWSRISILSSDLPISACNQTLGLSFEAIQQDRQLCVCYQLPSAQAKDM